MSKTETAHSLTSQQQELFENILQMIDEKVGSLLRSTSIEEYLISLTGPAGTGKTYLTTRIAEHLIRKQEELGYPGSIDYDFVITAPTHKAVSVLADTLSQSGIQANCRTIHSFLGIKPFIDFQTGEEKYKVDKTKKTKESTSILIVDESSMTGAELYEYILEAIEEGRANPVLFIGDPYISSREVPMRLSISTSFNTYMSCDEKYRLVYVAVTHASQYVKIFIFASGFQPGSKGSLQSDGINTVERFEAIDGMLETIL
jgi:GTPase SAR1 family protein